MLYTGFAVRRTVLYTGFGLQNRVKHAWERAAPHRRCGRGGRGGMFVHAHPMFAKSTSLHAAARLSDGKAG